MILREFLYVDADKVRGLLAQLDEGIIEGSSERTHHDKDSGVGFKGLAAHSQNWGNETTLQKSMADALFPTLEQALESLGILTDISQELMDADFWGKGMRTMFPPGSLVRVTAPAALFDARYVAATISAFATSYQGLTNVGVFSGPTQPASRKGQQGPRTPKRQSDSSSEPRQLEDDVPDVVIATGDGDGLSREYLQGIIRVARGVFSPGLHLNMTPTGTLGAIVTARLQEGRQFLDSDPEVLTARYGASEQEWTLVGSIGHYGQEPVADEDAPSLVNSDESVNRAGFAGFVNNFLLKLGSTGFIDLPQEPGFSVVPLAVYRLVGQQKVQGDAATA